MYELKILIWFIQFRLDNIFNIIEKPNETNSLLNKHKLNINLERYHLSDFLDQ